MTTMRALRAAVLIALAAGLLVFALNRSPLPDRRPPARHSDSGVLIVNPGEILLHAVPSIQAGWDNYRLPMSSVLGALLYDHLPASAWPALRAGFGVLNLLLVAALGCLLGGWTHGVLGAWALVYVTAFWPEQSALLAGKRFIAGPVTWMSPHYLQCVFTLLILLVAGLTVRRAKNPTWRRSLALGSAVGASLFFRSTLAFFPPVLILMELRAARASKKKLPWASWACLGLLPYAMLLPWWLMNAAVHGGFVPFETGSVSLLLAGAALGTIDKLQVPSIPAEWMAGTTPTAWAVREALSHPLRVAGGFFGRLAAAFTLEPVLPHFALGALWLRRRRAEERAAAALVLFFLVLHCAFPILDEYFMPLWPVFGALSVGVFLAPPAKEERSAELFSRAVLLGTLGAALALYLLTAVVVAAYAPRLPKTEAAVAARLDSEVARNPNEAWLLYERGLRRVRAADVAGAAADIGASVALSPEYEDRALMSAWLEARRGDPRAFLDWNARYPEGAHRDQALFRGHGFLVIGRPAEARRCLMMALSEPFNPHPSQSSTLASWEEACVPVAERLEFWFAADPAAKRLLLGELRKLAPSCRFPS
jgi:hypothetical protein